MLKTVFLFLVVMMPQEKTEFMGYAEARAKCNAEGKHLMVIVSAKWCASCQIMKRESILPMMKELKDSDVIVTVVDKDEQPELAEKIMKGDKLPQVSVFANAKKGLKRFTLGVGLQSIDRIKELLERLK
jgi:thioredoxin-related protein